MKQTHRLCVEIDMHYYVHYDAKEENLYLLAGFQNLVCISLLTWDTTFKR